MISVNKKYLLAGSPNSGKTTLFNALTGLHQHTANYSGVTVEKYIGEFKYNNTDIEVVDLPGIYSLYPSAIEEQLAIDEILNTSYDGIILVVNAEQIQKNLLLVLQILDLKRPTVLVLNMIDEAKKNKISINALQLSELLGIDVICTNSRTGEGIDELKSKLLNIKSTNATFYDWQVFQKTDKQDFDIDINFKSYENWIRFYLQHNSDFAFIEADLKYKNALVKYISSKCISNAYNIFQNKKWLIDKYLTHKIYGFIFLIITLLIVFQLVFFIAEYPMQWIEWSLTHFSGWLQGFLPQTEWANLIVNGVIPGITGVVMFVPQIALLFLMIGILEESGYMARVSFLLDSIFSKFGLSGKSLIPLVSGVACAVPSVLSTRTITNFKERLITILVLPFMSCSARLPVYTLLISLTVQKDSYWGFINIKGLMLLGLYLLGLLMALLYAWIFHKIIFQKSKTFFFIEMPSYKIPYWKNLLLNVWNKVKIFITDAGKIIMAISVILWYLSTHTFPSIQEQLDKKYANAGNNDSIQNAYQEELLEKSYIGIIGKTIQPLIKPLGYDWKIGIALVTSFAAREVFVGTMATLYSVNDQENIISLRDKIKAAEWTDTHQPVFTIATNISLLIYYALAMQCISTMVIVYRELKSFKWMLIQFVIMTGSAYLLAFIAYQVLK